MPEISRFYGIVGCRVMLPARIPKGFNSFSPGLATPAAYPGSAVYIVGYSERVTPVVPIECNAFSVGK